MIWKASGNGLDDVDDDDDSVAIEYKGSEGDNDIDITDDMMIVTMTVEVARRSCTSSRH